MLQENFFLLSNISSLLLWLDTFFNSQYISQADSESLKNQMMLTSFVSTLCQRILDVSWGYIESNRVRWSSIKYLLSDFVISDPPLPIHTHTLLTCIPSPLSTSVWIVFFKEVMTKIYFENYCQSKNHKQRYKLKKLL